MKNDSRQIFGAPDLSVPGYVTKHLHLGQLPPLKLTSSHLNMDGWKMKHKMAYFQGLCLC